MKLTKVAIIIFAIVCISAFLFLLFNHTNLDSIVHSTNNTFGGGSFGNKGVLR